MRRLMNKIYMAVALAMLLLVGGIVTVSAAEPVKVTQITAQYSGSVKVNTTIDESRFTVVAYYSDGTNAALKPSEFTISPTSVTEVGNNVVTVTYNYRGEAVSADSTVVGRTFSNLTRITAEYTGGVVATGDLIDRGDVKVTAYYGDGSSAEVTTWYFANYIISNGNNIVYLVYEEDGYIRNCNIKVPGETISKKELIRINAEYIGDGVLLSGTINRADVQVSAYYKYISAANVVNTSLVGVTDWWFDDYNIRKGSNNIIIYFEHEGTVVSDEITVEGFEYSGSWVVENGIHRFRDNKGNYLKNEWYQENGIWYHFDDGGIMDTGWEIIGDSKYYFDDWGRMTVGWKNIGNQWYYFNTDGSMALGWVKDGLYWYYMDLDTGEMCTSQWIEYRGRWYYLSQLGIMATGWFKDQGVWYYLTDSGAMATGWYKVNDIWYYSDKNGAMAADKWIDNYYVDATGAWVKSR